MQNKPHLSLIIWIVALIGIGGITVLEAAEPSKLMRSLPSTNALR